MNKFNIKFSQNCTKAWLVKAVPLSAMILRGLTNIFVIGYMTFNTSYAIVVLVSSRKVNSPLKLGIFLNNSGIMGSSMGANIISSILLIEK